MKNKSCRSAICHRTQILVMLIRKSCFRLSCVHRPYLGHILSVHMANREYGSLSFSQQLRLLTAALDSKDPKRILRYLIPFAMLYDPETKGEEIKKNSATIKRSPLLDQVVENVVK